MSADLLSRAVNMDGFCKMQSVKTISSQPKTILHRMHLDFPANSVTAILGPSGSGKTTLLSVLTDSIQSNVDAHAQVFLPGVAAFCPQDDRLHGFYTCKSYLQHYARMAGISTTPELLEQRIDKLLKELGLTEQADTIVGDVFLKGLSGGQKRRLSVALEALSEPQNFFLDEPTSGLDAESALQVMEFLKRYVRESSGRRVILTIHQPSSFIWTKIDHVILLSKGQLMYNGDREMMEHFFQNAGYPTEQGWNPADHYVTAVNDEFRDHDLSVPEWAAKYKQWERNRKRSQQQQAGGTGGSSSGRSRSIIAAGNTAVIETSRTKSPTVILEMTRRYFLNLAFNPGILGTRIAMYSMLALMVGALFWDLGERTDFASVQSRTAVLFYCVAFFIFMSVAVLPFTVIERAIVDKEVGNNYYNPVYYQISQGISSIPGCAILAFLVTLLVITMTKLNEPVWYFINMFLSLMVAEALAQLVSHVVPHFVIGMALVAGMYGFFMLFQGFMLVPSEFPNWLSWVYYVAFHTYSWRTFMVNEFRGEPELEGQFPTGEDVLIFYEIEDVDRSNDMIVLVGYCLILHLAASVVLHLRYTMFHGKILPITDEDDMEEDEQKAINDDDVQPKQGKGAGTTTTEQPVSYDYIKRAKSTDSACEEPPGVFYEEVVA